MSDHYLLLGFRHNLHYDAGNTRAPALPVQPCVTLATDLVVPTRTSETTMCTPVSPAFYRLLRNSRQKRPKNHGPLVSIHHNAQVIGLVAQSVIWKIDEERAPVKKFEQEIKWVHIQFIFSLFFASFLVFAIIYAYPGGSVDCINLLALSNSSLLQR